jgi:small subunit ribosomal protein S8
MTDAIADMLTIIRNGYLASKFEVTVPFSKLKKNLAEKLKGLGYLEEVSEETAENRKLLRIKLRYANGKPEVEGIKRISKPGLRVYKDKNQIPYVYGGLGAAIISTNKGLLSDREARKNKVGGEIICEVW